MPRRAAARQMMVASSSAIKWFARWQSTGSIAEKPGKKAQPSPLDAHSDWLLALVEKESDLTLEQIVGRLFDELQVTTTDSSVSRFFQRHGISYKKNPARQRAAPGRRGAGARGLEGGPAGT